MLASLRYPQFRALWVATVVSNLGAWLQVVAQDFLVYQLNGRALDLGVVYLMRALPLLAISLLGGAVSDRYDRRKLLIVTQSTFAGLAVVLGALAHSGLIQLGHVMAVSFLSAVVLAIDTPVRQAVLVEPVPRPQLTNAVALNALAFSLPSAVGPALAGPVIAWLGIPWGFYLNGLSFLAVAVAALGFPSARGRHDASPRGSVAQDLREGARFILASPQLRVATGLLAIISFFAAPYQALLPAFAVEVFGGSIQQLSYLKAGPGLGAIAGGLLVARFASRQFSGWIMAAAGMGLSLLLLAFSSARHMGMAVGLLICAGMLLAVFQSTVQSLMQTLSTDQMRGRVMSLFTAAMMGMWPLGSLPLGWAADRLGPALTMAVAAALALLLCTVVVAVSRPVLKAME